MMLEQIYAFVDAGNSDAAIQHFLEHGLPDCNSVLEVADVDRLDAPVIVAILLGTRGRKSDLAARAEFSNRAKRRLNELLPSERVERLWDRVG